MKKQINTSDIAYIAGYIDGDGCFYLGTESTKKRLKPKYISNIIITSVNSEILNVFKQQFGGSVAIKKNSNPTHKPLYQWTTCINNSLFLAQTIYPYLVEKKAECSIFISSMIPGDIRIRELRNLKQNMNLVEQKHKQEFELCRNTTQPSEDDFAYLAGFIDAECCFTISKYKPKNKPNRVYKILLQCNNTKAPVFKWLLERFGGHVHFINRSTCLRAKKNQMTWRIGGKALFKIINRIVVYLRYKKPVCEQLIKFYATTLPNGGARHTEFFRTQYADLIFEREKIISNVHKLNLKGINHLSG